MQIQIKIEDSEVARALEEVLFTFLERKPYSGTDDERRQNKLRPLYHCLINEMSSCR